MATVSGSVSFLSHPPTKLHLSSSSQSPSSSSSSSSSSPPQVPVPNLSSNPQSETPIQSVSVKSQEPPKPKVAATAPDTTDWVASTLTRRFGLGAGLAWAGFLAIGVLSEQIKTRLEVAQEEANTKDVEEAKEVVLSSNGIRYYDLRIGGGASPRPGDLVVIDLRGQVEGSGEVFVDTFGREKKPLALVMGSRPYTRGMCEGIEYVLRSMKAGGKRRVIVPPRLGFGDKGADLGSGVQIPPSATLEFIVQVDKVSIAPA